jgi:GTP-binding protein EngB required for normal cell division
MGNSESVYFLQFPIIGILIRLPSKTRIPNVIVFGETGAGKSSVVNMLAGKPIAATSSAAAGVTFQSNRHEIMIRGLPFNIYDTVGLSEGDAGKVTARTAIKSLYRLICEVEGGVNLLVYVVRGPRIRGAARKNYHMFHEIFCKKKVPIVIVVTGLEEEHDRQAWWESNKEHFLNQDMVFAAAACITASRGKNGVYSKDYEESKRSVEDVVLQWRANEPWHPPTTSATWFVTVCVDIFNRFAGILSFTPAFAKFMEGTLMLCGDVDERAASFAANNICESCGSMAEEAAPFMDDIREPDRRAKSTAGTTTISTVVRQRINQGISSLPGGLTARFKTLLG